MEAFVTLILYFTLYSFLGWVCETAYCSIGARKFINRGFLVGPVCPVYGFGALLVIAVLTPAMSLPHSWAMVFLCGLILTSLLEYLTGWLLETAFHMKWWDYEGRICNIKGRVCLGNSIMFGLLCVALMFGIHPFLRAQIEGLAYTVQIAAASAFVTCFAIDCFFSIRATLRLSGKLQKIHQTVSEFYEKQKLWAQEKGEKYAEVFQQGREKLHIPALPESASEKLGDLHRSMLTLKDKLSSLERPSFTQRRLLDAFPHLHAPRLGDTVEQLRERIKQQRGRKKQNNIQK